MGEIFPLWGTGILLGILLYATVTDIVTILLSRIKNEY